jgi:hypothetical protein
MAKPPVEIVSLNVCFWPVAAPRNKIARFAGWSFQIGDGGQAVPVP